MANARKLRGLVTGAAALLLVIGLASASWAQVPSWQQERSKIKATLEETDPGALGRIAAATDRGVATMGLGQLSVYTYNFGLTTGRVFSSGRWMFPNVNGTNYSYIFVSSPAFGVEAGPWGGAQVFESTSETHSLSQIDWEAVDGSRGLLFSDPPVTLSGYPIFATSDLPLTWPSTGWPAPADVIEVWETPDTWDKWAVVGDRNSYAEFSDAYAARDNTGQSYALGIEVKQRAISYAGFNATFFQFEFTNTSSYNLTGVHIGQIADSGTPTTGDYTGYILYDESRQLLWVRSTSFDPATGTHTRSATNTTPASFVGTMWLESPTGNFRQDASGDTVHTPSQVLTRVALMDWSDAVNLADGEATMYGALSGRYELMTDKSDQVWKISQNIGGSVGTPKYKQSSENFLAMYGTTGDAYYYVSSGPLAMPAGASFDYVLAAVAAYTEPDLLAAADKAIRSYNKQYKGPSPPPSPANFKANGVKAGPHGREYDSRLHAYETYYVPSGGVTLTWDMSLTMTVPDPLSGNLDFEGIRLYRSNDRGRSWGTGITDVSGRRVEWVPYWTWDLVDGIKGMDGLSFTNLGNDTGLVSSFVDTFNVYDGIEYWYAIAAYDQGEFDPVSGDQLLRSLESPRGNDPSFPAMISVIPGTRPSGWVEGGPTVPGAVAVLPVSAVNSRAAVTVGVVDDSSVKDATYRLTFGYDSVFGIDSYPNWYGVTLENRTTGDTLCVNLLPEHSAIGVNLLPEFEGLQVAVNTDWNANPSASGRKSYSFPSQIVPYSGYEMSYGDTRFMNSTIHSNDVQDLAEVFFPAEIRWSATETQLGYVYYRTPLAGPNYGYAGVGTFPGTVWDVSDPANPRQVNMLWSIQGNRPPIGNFDYNIRAASSSTYRSYAAIMNSDYDAGASTVYVAGTNYQTTPFDWIYESWLGMDQTYLDSIAVDPTYTMGEYLDGLVNHYYYRRTLAEGTTYEFTTTASTIDEDEVTVDDVKVVPNPYYILAEWDQNDNRRKIQFINVPANSTIDIYTLSGELVASLDHHGDSNASIGSKGYNSSHVGTVDWNIWTYEYTEAAYGLYIYVVKTDDGQTKVGKFAVIR